METSVLRHGCGHVVAAIFTSLVLASIASAAPDLSRISYDSQCVQIDGHDTFLYSGSFHYFRCPKALWADRFQKMKDAGMNCVETYVAWNWHERQPPADVNDFSKMDMSELNDWLDMAINRFGFYVILRPGPYICAEWDGGGYPQWLMTKKPANAPEHWLRGDDATYLDWCRHWYAAAAKTAAPFQITHMPAGKPGVILWQIENEYNYAWEFSDAQKLHQLQALAHASRDDGIDVPLITCMTTNPLYRQDDFLLKNVIECRNSYPRFDPAAELRDLTYIETYQPEKPRLMTELQGGWFSDIGHDLSENMGYTPAQITHVTLLAWAKGFTGTNYYMMFGGTNIGDWGAAFKTTSYDYAAPIREWGGVGPRYFAVCAMANFLKAHGEALCRAKEVALSPDVSSDNLSVYARQTKDGERFIFIFNNQEHDRAAGTLHLSSSAGNFSGNITYDLSPYEAKILYLPAGQTDPGREELYPQAVKPPQRPTNLPAPVSITAAKRTAVKMGDDAKWTPLPEGGSVESAGIFDRRYVFYRAQVPAQTQPAPALRFYLSAQDSVLVQIDDQPLKVQRFAGGVYIVPLPAKGGTLTLLYENGGRDNGGPAIDRPCGPRQIGVSTNTVLPTILRDWRLQMVAGEAAGGDAAAGDIASPADESSEKVDISGDSDAVRAHQTGIFKAQIDLSAEDVAGGKILVFGSVPRESDVYCNGKKLSAADEGHYDLTPAAKVGANTLAVVVKAGHWSAGIHGGAELDSAQKPQLSTLDWRVYAPGDAASDATEDDSQWEAVDLRQQGAAAADPAGADAGALAPQLTDYRLHFALPALDSHVWVPWKLHLKASGNGFIYLNGHLLGRQWDVGPQSDFFLPECWLNFGGGANVIALRLRPTKGAAAIEEAAVGPYGEYAEFRN
jgi:hypothetical protein